MTRPATAAPHGGTDAAYAGEAAAPSGAGGGQRGRNRLCAAAAIEAVAGPDGTTRLPVLASQVPLVLRRTPEAVYLVGGAAGPIGGDRLDLRITVRAGAFLRVRSAAASIALPGLDGLESQLHVTVLVEEGGRLEYLPEPVVITAGARHVTVVSATLAAGASLLIRDELLLGRHGEHGGTARSVLRADYADRPLLRHAVEVSGADPVSLGPAVLAGHRAFGTLLRAGAAGAGQTGSASGTGLAGGLAGTTEATGADKVHGPADGNARDPAGGTWRVGGAHASERGTGQPAVAVMPLAGPGTLVTALAGDAVTLRRYLTNT